MTIFVDIYHNIHTLPITHVLECTTEMPHTQMYTNDLGDERDWLAKVDS